MKEPKSLEAALAQYARDSSRILEPQTGAEGLYTVRITLETVCRELQNFDPSGNTP